MSTPLISAPQLAAALGLPTKLYLKREDLNPYGSHKGRSIPVMMKRYAEAGQRQFVISSSGNAALAATLYVLEYNKTHPNDPLTLTIFVGPKIPPEKLQLLTASLSPTPYSLLPTPFTITQVPNPKQAAFLLAKNSGAQLLRQSTDDSALLGYSALAAELLAELPDLAAIFIPTSSGTTAEGLHSGFNKLGSNPEIHIIQTDVVHPFVQWKMPARLAKQSVAGGENGKWNIKKNSVQSLATAIVDKIGYRGTKIAEVLKNSRGMGWIATNTDIEEAMKTSKNNLDFTISANSALGLAGLKKAINSGHTWSGPIVALVTGR